jgi:hypothetical protein
VHHHVAKIPQSIFKMSELGAGMEGAAPLLVVREGAAKELAREALGSVGTTGSERVGGYVLYLIHNILKDVEARRLQESIQQVPLISRNDL